MRHSWLTKFGILCLNQLVVDVIVGSNRQPAVSSKVRVTQSNAFVSHMPCSPFPTASVNRSAGRSATQDALTVVAGGPRRVVGTGAGVASRTRQAVATARDGGKVVRKRWV